MATRKVTRKAPRKTGAKKTALKKTAVKKTAAKKKGPVKSRAKGSAKPSPGATPQAAPPLAAKQTKAVGGKANIRVRMYRIGFGDFFLLTVPGNDGPAHILIDCGVHAAPVTGSMD